MTEARKENLISFRVSEDYFQTIEKLADKLGLGRSECIRLILDEGIERYLGQKSPLLVLNDEKWNSVVGARLENFLEGITGFNKNVTEFTKYLETLSSQVKKTSNVQNGDSIDVTEADLAKWIDLCIKDDRGFDVKDENPEAEKAKKAILTTIQKLRGRVE